LAGRAEQPVHDPQDVDQVDWLIRKLRPRDGSRAPGRMAPVGARPPSQVRYVPVPMRPITVRLSVALGVALGVALPYWPYPNACGWSLIPYFFSVGLVVITGLWGARLTWDARLGFTHSAAIATMLWGLALLALHVLPRVGYAKAHAAWFCSY
jgi:hypothetical protein